MNEKSQIDDVFKNALHDFQEVEPSKKVWFGITSGVFLNSIVLSFVSSLTRHTASWLVGAVCVLSTTAFLIFSPDIDSNSDETLTTTILDENIKKPISKTQNATSQKTKVDLSANTNSNNTPTQINFVQNTKSQTEKKYQSPIGSEHPALKNNQQITQKTSLATESSAIEKKSSGVLAESIVNPHRPSTIDNLVLDYFTSNSISDVLAKLQFSMDSVMQIMKKKDSIIITYKDTLSKIGNLGMNITNPNDKPKENSRFALFNYGSAAKITKNLNGDIPSSAYVTKRINSEGAVTNLGFGSELRYLLNNHFYVKGGFSLATYGEKVDYLMKQFVGLDSASVTDSIFSYSYTKAVNRFNYLEVPLTLGSKFVINNTTFYFDGGISIGYLINASGKLINKENLNSTVHISASRLPITKFMYNYILRAGVSHNIYNNISIFAEPFYKQNIQSVLSRKYDIQQKYTSMGVNVGIKFDL